ncbi:Pls/PosA family non-ribosomal peptide synthetase [Singulisphaera acidiphila]|uniref:Amino acid adenylation enzyme/thioester reductase family protein n=1 Tax=Singulisphaera acidiphila (strain ATCC BAA-1392 / DSM 18658 / VKM B-2454 / MOB10) TaxID=886293 RepID=L0DHF3_SINAD|nr:Pls/PosA family non-ribosomal peptide synthetase [Singulisphaera acidiphila]AGA28101.1 amino acid adenylation enzyme/thioester reductase family protein [Singulisphaera acidiphila DSM 18658]
MLAHGNDQDGRHLLGVVTLASDRNREGRSQFPHQYLTPTVQHLHLFFERTVDARPDALALACGDERLSYSELDARANQFAHHLARLGIRPGDRVGLLLERSVPLYVALLGTLKCGATFVPIDTSLPTDRIAFIAEDAELALLVTYSSSSSPSHRGLNCRILDWTLAVDLVATESELRIEVCHTGPAAAYIIYTSGTTGRPKGVLVNHSSVCNFIDVCRPVYEVGPLDRVYQGMTLAFDFSIEEIWPTWASGATLVAGPTDHRRLGAGLTDFLIAEQITVVFCVPTLLATIEREVPTLRTLIVGGESCPEALVSRWARDGRRMLNTYGPTEATVTATWSELEPGKPVTIGRPLATYTVCLLGEDRTPVPEGEVGEICIGGPGVVVGYLNRPDLTLDRFISNPFDPEPGARLYRTGDLGRFTPEGELEFLGRFDSQVKVRGYRVEPQEIEAVLREDDAVSDAVVVLGAAEGGSGDLIAYITLRNGDLAETLRTRLHVALRRRLPAYMCPAYIEVVDVLSSLPSGKVDRSRLPRPCSPRLAEATSAPHVAPATPLESRLAEAWAHCFGRAVVSVEADFFQELGGHSLTAATLVSSLRQAAEFRNLSIADLYANPTVRLLAGHLEAQAPRATARAEEPRLQHSNRRVRACGVVQFGLLYLMLLVLAAPGLLLTQSGAAAGTAVGFAVTTVVAFGLAIVISAVLPLLVRWTLVGRFQPGRYPLWGWYYCRWWLVRKLLELAPLDLLAGTPLLPAYARLLGARIGKDCQIATSLLMLPDLIEIGEGASIGYAVALEPFLVEDGWLHLAPIRIGAGAFIGTNSVVMLGSRIEAGARVAEQSLVARDQTIPADASWAGSPSSAGSSDPQLDALESLPAPAPWSPALLAGFLVGSLVLELLPVLLLAPGLALLYYDLGDYEHWLHGVSATPLAGLVYVLTTCVAVAVGKRLVMPRARPGVYALRSWFGLRKWFSDRLMELSLGSTNSLYATLFTSSWLRALGAKVGPRAEISTVSNIDPDLLVVGAESFVADLAVIGAARYHRGRVVLGTTELGPRSFVGNAALVPGAAFLPHDSLIGVQSVPPAEAMEPGSSWLGSPAIFLPRRQDSGDFEESVTYRPPLRLVAGRLAVECVRIVLPATLMYLAILIGLKAAFIMSDWPIGLRLIVLPAVYLASGLAVTLVSAALKWVVVGRYRPRVVPMWSFFVWRTELITALYENVAVPWLLHWFTGTPFMAPLLRLFGARVGRRVYMETTFLTEFDLVRVDDDAMVAGWTSLQTHLFEDRVMKMSALTVGRGCTVGTRSVVLYDAEMAAGSRLEALSLVMKGERLPAESRWRGIPARLAD